MKTPYYAKSRAWSMSSVRQTMWNGELSGAWFLGSEYSAAWPMFWKWSSAWTWSVCWFSAHKWL